ncbi:hypothetical protein ACO0K9_21400 [Undibacterium sp. Ji50W]|uniref:hypothetical protein n=1 Tax=Undibacterium sp. Ji50W TaxID=3413041 RepID=UPI003BEF7FAB
MTQESYQEQMNYWLDLWKKGEPVLPLLISVCEEGIAKTGETSFFSNAPIEVQERILEDIQLFRQHGSRVFFIVGGNFYHDKTKEMEKVIEILETGNLIDKEAIQVLPLTNAIEGVTFIHGGELLQEILNYDPKLSDCSFTEFSIRRTIPHYSAKYIAEFSILFEHFVRNYLDEEKFERTLVSRWAASFSLTDAIQQAAQLEKIFFPTMSIEKQKIGSRHYYEVRLNDFFGHSTVFLCKEIKLVKLEHLKIDDENCSGE